MTQATALFLINLGGSLLVGLVAGFFLPRAAYRRGMRAGLADGLRAASASVRALHTLLIQKGVTPEEFERALASAVLGSDLRPPN